MKNSLLLPRPDGKLEKYETGNPSPFPSESQPPESRVVYAAAHVVADPVADADPFVETAVDWKATLQYRHHLWGLGFGVAEAMDTAQRGMGLDWETTKELIRRSVSEARSAHGKIACGAGTDQLESWSNLTLQDVEQAYREQCEFVEGEGGQIILMASGALASVARSPEDYLRVYEAILTEVSQPVILHWLGEAFDPQLSHYWGHEDLGDAMEVCLSLIEAHSQKIDGIKLSLLSADREREMRARLPHGVSMYTGDDFRYPELILGDHAGSSDALLGIFDAIAPAAVSALHALDTGDTREYERIFDRTVPLARHIFQAPTRFYKTGLVFLAYLNGYQEHFRMVGGLESARSTLHLATLFVLADQAGLLSQPDLATERMRRVLALSGIES
jgi:hypothetical protein